MFGKKDKPQPMSKDGQVTPPVIPGWHIYMFFLLQYSDRSVELLDFELYVFADFEMSIGDTMTLGKQAERDRRMKKKYIFCLSHAVLNKSV